MPGPALHFLFAGSVYREWQAAPVAAPFEPGAATRSAFLRGAPGPDMGYFPGADPLVSELAHHARTGAFCRALVQEARTDAGRAFAWGWVTHVLADVAVHPLVNEACGELTLGSRTPLWGPEVAVAHLPVETGLDAAYHARHPELASVRTLPALDDAVFHCVRSAYLRTCGAAPEVEALVRAHRQVSRLLGPGAHVRGMAARAQGGSGGAWAARMALRAAARLAARNAHARGLFSPVRPAPWLLDEVDGIAAGVADWFGAHYGSGLRFLRDHCLDTGGVHEHDPPCARRAMEALRGASVRRAGAARGGVIPRRANGSRAELVRSAARLERNPVTRARQFQGAGTPAPARPVLTPPAGDPPMASEADEHAMRCAREEEAALALWSTLSHPTASEAEWRRLPEAVRHHYRLQARMALGFDPRGFDARGEEAYAAGA